MSTSIRTTRSLGRHGDGEVKEFKAPINRGRRRSRRDLPLLLFTLPALVIYIFVIITPTLRGARLSFTNWDGLSKTFDWVGFENFVNVFKIPTSFHALYVTLLIAFVVTVLQNLFGLLLALGVSSNIKSRNILRVAFFTPVMITPVVVAYLWQYLLAPNGPVNDIVGAFSPRTGQIPWLGTPALALASVIAIIVWQNSGFSMVIYLAGIQAIPDDLLEAAAVDGAKPIRRFTSITWPLLGPATAINLILTVIAGLKVFTEVYILTAGGPGTSTQTLSTLLYQEAFQFNQFGFSIAMAIVLAIIVALFTGAQFAISRRSRMIDAY